MMKKQLSPALCGLCVVGAGVLWGTTGLFVRHFTGLGLSSLTISSLRAVVTAVILLLAVLLFDRAALRVKWRDLWCFFGTGVCSVLVFNYCYFHTIEETSMAVAATLLYTSPVFVMLLSLWLFGERITGRKIAALALAVAGCVLVSGILTGGGALTGKGVLLGIGAGLGYALYSIFSRCALRRGYSSLTVTVYTFLFAAAGGAFLLDWGEMAAAVSASPVLPAVMTVYALVTTVAPYLLYTVGLTGVENSKAAVMAAVEPVTAALLGLIVFREIPDPPACVGILLVLGAVTVLNIGAGSAKTKE